MDIISSTVQASDPVSGTLVKREVIIAVFGFSVAQAREDAVQRFYRENGHPEATVEAIAHTIIERPSSGRAWTKQGTYHITLRVTGQLEDMTLGSVK